MSARESVTVVCPHCAAVMPAGLARCGECGGALTASPNPAPATAPVDATSTAAPSTSAPKNGSDGADQPTEESGNDHELASETDADFDALIESFGQDPDVTDEASSVSDAGAAPADADDLTPAADAMVDVDRSVDASLVPESMAGQIPERDVPAHPAGALTAADGSSSSRAGSRDRPPRWLLIGGVLGAVAVVALGAMWVSGSAFHAASNPTRPVASATATAAPVVTLPGWSTSPAWSATGVSQVAVSSRGGLVSGVVSGRVVVWDASTGQQVTTGTPTGSNLHLVGGTLADDVPAVAAVTDTEAWVWAAGRTTPTKIDLTGGRHVETRTGVLIVTGPDRTFSGVTSDGEIPFTSPREGAIVVGVDQGTVVWGTSDLHLVTAAPNAAVLSDAVLTPPAAGAVVTPKTGWVRASTAAVTVLGWTLPDGSQVTGRHDTSAGQLLDSIPGTGTGVLSPDRTEWTADGHRIPLSSTTAPVVPLPDGFVPARYLGAALYGATSAGAPALLTVSDASTEGSSSTPAPSSGDSTTPGTPVPSQAASAAPSPAGSAGAVPVSTVTPVAVADGMLLALTGGHLDVFAPTDKARK